MSHEPEKQGASEAELITEAERVGKLIGVELYQNDPIVFHGIQSIAGGKPTEEMLVAMVRAYAGAYGALREEAVKALERQAPSIEIATPGDLRAINGGRAAP